MPYVKNIRSTGTPLICCQSPSLFVLNIEPSQILFSRENDDLLLISKGGDVSMVEDFFVRNAAEEGKSIQFLLPEGTRVSSKEFLAGIALSKT